MPDQLRCEVVVVAYKSRGALEPFLDRLGRSVPVILVDNSVELEDLSDLVAAYPNVRHVDGGGNLGYSAASNLGAKIATAEFLVFMNPDTRPTESDLARLTGFLDTNPDVASCGAAGAGTAGGGAQPTLLRVLVHAIGLHRLLPLSGIYYQDLGGRRVDVGWVAGSCLAIRRSTFNRVGGFDPRYFVYQSDFDLGLRIRQHGRRQVVLGDVVITHLDGGSSDLPQTWTGGKRGRAWTRFLRNTRRPPAALVLSTILVAGYAARAVLYTLSGRRGKATEMRAYMRAVAAQWINPE